MQNSKYSLPPEIERFFISEEVFEGIVGDSVDTDVKSVEFNGGDVKITVPKDFLKKTLGEKYGRGIETVNVDGDEVDIKLSQEAEEAAPEEELGNSSEDVEEEQDDEPETGEEDEPEEKEIEGDTEGEYLADEEMSRLAQLRNSITGES